MEKQNKIVFEMYKYRKPAITVTLRDDSTLEDIYEIAKTRMFTKQWQYYNKYLFNPMNEIVEEIQPPIIHDVFVADENYNDILSIPNDKTKTIREFMNENHRFFSKSASYVRTLYSLYVVDEIGVQEMIAHQTNPKPATSLFRYINCMSI
jgi:hypothetical protein